MSERRSSADLGPDAEAALSAFPIPERDWERDARAIDAQLFDGIRGTTTDSLLAAPLPSEPGEPGVSSATATPLTSSGVRTQSLAELARRSVEKKQANERELARASLAIATRQRPSSEDVRALRETGSSPRAAAPAPPAPVPAPSLSSAVVASSGAISVSPQANSSSSATSPWPRLALGIPALAFAAAALFWLKRPEPTPLLTSTLPSATSEAKPVAAAAITAPVTGSGAVASNGVDPSTLPSESPSKPDAAAHAKLAAASAAAPVAASAAAKTKTEKVVLEDEQPAAIAAAPRAAERPVEKTLPPDPALRPADSSGGELPVKPSTGAVQAALGSVMSGARHCVAGDEAPSSAVVVFGSDGRVQHVSVTGPAAGKSSGACIEAQLSHARVQPFAAANFSVSATVRPD